jgi:hypothetical protein
METLTLSHDVLVADEDAINPRVLYNEDVIETYVELYAESLKTQECPLPPLDVFLIEGRYYVADGFHRLAAAWRAQAPPLLCRVHQGTMRDAMLFAAEANAHHGLPYSSGDKKQILHRVLADPDISALSDRAIARRFGMSHTYVARIRQEAHVHHTFDTELAAQVATVASPPRGVTPEQHGLALVFGLPPKDLRDIQREEWSASTTHLRNNLLNLVTKSGLSYEDAKAEVGKSLHDAAKRLTTRRSGKPYQRQTGTIGHAQNTPAAPAPALHDDGMEAVTTRGLDGLITAWRKANDEARRSFRVWMLAQPLEEYGPTTTSEDTEQYSTVIAQVCGRD